MPLAVLTVDADGTVILQNFLVGLLLHHDCGFIPTRIERLYVVILQLALQNRIEVQHRLICVAELEILIHAT